MQTNSDSTTDSDVILKLDDGSTIQHGEFNDRVYLLKISEQADEALPNQLIKLAYENNYSKIFAKIPSKHLNHFLQAGFIVEAMIPRMFANAEDGYFLAFYHDVNRMMENDAKHFEEIKEVAEIKLNAIINELHEKYQIRKCHESDADAMAKLYAKVFPSYPFPINEPEYLLKTMRENVRYFCVEDSDMNKIVALSSAEIDFTSQNAEMTDFATHPESRNNGFGVHLLKTMEKALADSNISTFYTIARAASFGMNITFAKSGYRFAGRLKNNTNISGNIESMNVWYRHAD